MYHLQKKTIKLISLYPKKEVQENGAILNLGFLSVLLGSSRH